MRALLSIGLFIVIFFATTVMCGFAALLLGLEHPSLPDWWRQLVSTAITITGLVVAGVATWLANRTTRAAPPPYRGYPPPPPPSYPPR